MHKRKIGCNHDADKTFENVGVKKRTLANVLRCKIIKKEMECMTFLQGFNGLPQFDFSTQHFGPSFIISHMISIAIHCRVQRMRSNQQIQQTQQNWKIRRTMKNSHYLPVMQMQCYSLLNEREKQKKEEKKHVNVEFICTWILNSAPVECENNENTESTFII